MEMIVNSEFVKSERLQRGWSQEHLAEVAGLSLRTIQRIESDGSCSLESRNALGAALDMAGADLERGAYTQNERKDIERGLFWGNLGVWAGMIFGGLGIVAGFFSDETPREDFWLILGLWGAIAGIVLGGFGVLARFIRKKHGLL